MSLQIHGGYVILGVADIMQGSRVRIPRGPATVMRAFRALSRVAASAGHESTIDGGVRMGSAAADYSLSVCLCCKKHPFITERVFSFLLKAARPACLSE